MAHVREEGCFCEAGAFCGCFRLQDLLIGFLELLGIPPDFGDDPIVLDGDGLDLRAVLNPHRIAKIAGLPLPLHIHDQIAHGVGCVVFGHIEPVDLGLC